ncbi:hypothetical protein M3Y97_00138800 [Aphelenchoides bicaudatus]|nr:hypothetical protein M3Y97_00138800 [Aphelenchoides bicaudatus]
MRLLLCLIVLLCCVLLIEGISRHSKSRSNRKSRKTQRSHGYEKSTNEEHRGRKQSSRQNSTRTDESENLTWDSSGKGSRSHTKNHNNSASNQDNNEEEFYRNSTGRQWGSGRRAPWQKPTDDKRNPKKNEGTHDGLGQGFEGNDKQPHIINNPLGRPHPNNNGSKPQGGKDEGLGQGFEGDNKHPNNGSDQLGQQLETVQPHVDQTEHPLDQTTEASSTSTPKTSPKKKGNKRSRCRPFGGMFPKCGDLRPPHGHGPMKLPPKQKGNGNHMPGKKGPHNGQATPNGNNPDAEKPQPDSENGLGDSNGDSDPIIFNPGLFCQMTRREKCLQLEQELCPGTSKPERQSECLRVMCSSRTTRCAMSKNMADSCGRSVTDSAIHKEICA